MSINVVSISGNLTRDPELRATGGGTQVLSMGVAVNERRRNAQTGEWEDSPQFVDVVVFGGQAEALSRMLSKGSKVALSGRLRYSSWETKDGQRRSKLEVVGERVEVMTPRQPRQAAPTGHAAPAPAAPVARQAPAPAVYDEDIPF